MLVYRERIGEMWLVAHRWYFPKAITNIPTNAINFRDRLLELKSGKQPVIEYFSLILKEIWESVFNKPDAIIAIPPSWAGAKEFPLKALASLVTSDKRHGLNLTPLLRRVHTVPSAHKNPYMHNISKQKVSMGFQPEIPNGVESLLLIDDVTTTGATLRAAAELIQENYLNMKITCFAFGKTEKDEMQKFPSHPSFRNPLPRTLEKKKAHSDSEEIPFGDEGADAARIKREPKKPISILKPEKWIEEWKPFPANPGFMLPDKVAQEFVRKFRKATEGGVFIKFEVYLSDDKKIVVGVIKNKDGSTGLDFSIYSRRSSKTPITFKPDPEDIDVPF